MADYIGRLRTNYFRVKDETLYQRLISKLISDDRIDFYDEKKQGTLYHCFTASGTLEWTDDSNGLRTLEIEPFYRGMQHVIADEDAFVLLEVGWEKFRYLYSGAVVVTQKQIKYLGMSDIINATCKELLGENFTTQLEY